MPAPARRCSAEEMEALVKQLHDAVKKGDLEEVVRILDRGVRAVWRIVVKVRINIFFMQDFHNILCE